MKNNRPLVSIFCTTYNHEKYIKDAIEGFLMQKTDFQYEIVIHDDASTDGTIAILKEYERRYPELIRVIYEAENQYSKLENAAKFFIDLERKELKGKYIAICEGDDYWIDADKLQMQIDYMEKHPDCVMSGHDAIMINCKTGEKRKMKRFQEGDLSTVDVILSAIPTASRIYQKDMLNINRFFLEAGEIGDYPFQLFCSTRGKIHYFDKAMSVHFIMTESSWTKRQAEDICSFCKSRVDVSFLLEKFNNYTKLKYDQLIKGEISSMMNQVVPRANGLSVQQFCDICEKFDCSSLYQKHRYYAELVNTFRQYYDLNYLDGRITDFIQKHRYVLIWGAGYYGRRISEQFRNNGVEFNGFVVSDNQDIDENYQDKEIWNISQLPYSRADMGIVIAVRQEIKDEIINALQSNGIERYIYPFEVMV